MTKKVELKIRDPKNIYHEVALALAPHRKKKEGSIEFIVEGSIKNPIIGIRYPGKKLVKRELKVKRKNSAEWGNLYDFYVVPYVDGKEEKKEDFTFEKILKDYEKNKRKSEKFWKCVEEIYKENVLTSKPPKLPGIDSKLFLLVLKWLWIEEDFNYKYNWKDVESPVRYVLISRTDNLMSKGAGRAKFFSAMILLRYGFTFDEVKKIIPLY